MVKPPDNAIDKREFMSYHNAFEFYVTGPINPRNGCYPIYRYINVLNGVGSWQHTMGNAEWVEQSRIIETYKTVTK